MSYAKDPRVDAYIDQLPAWQRAVCHEVRDQGERLNTPALAAMFRHIIANNRAGGWRKLKKEG